jgi:hypothetical protein
MEARGRVGVLPEDGRTSRRPTGGLRMERTDWRTSRGLARGRVGDLLEDWRMRTRRYEDREKERPPG